MKTSKQNVVLFLVSFIILFLEVTLIRWISTEVRIFAYFNNLVLLACFLGIGLGCYLSQKKIRIFITFLLLTVLIILIHAPLRVAVHGQSLHLFTDIPIFIAAFQDSIIGFQKTIQDLVLMQFAGILATVIVFLIILLIFYPLGQILGRVFDQHENIIKAYSINVAASLLGVWAFSGLSFVYSPPWIWLFSSIVLTAIMMFYLEDFQKKNIITLAMCLLLAVPVLFMSSKTTSEKMTMWSPYQKLTLEPIKPYKEGIDPYKSRLDSGYVVSVNNIGYMSLYNLSDSFRRLNPMYFAKQELYIPHRIRGFGPYDLPYVFKKDVESVLLLGAGAGNDAAGAIRGGAKNIDAVEIDAGVYKLGERYHPEQPYSDPRFRIIIDDARSFLKKSKEKYDIVYFGLLDAHSQSSNFNNMRMDHYVYTQEAFLEAKEALKDDGIMTVTFWVPRLWVGQRIKGLLTKTFGWEPIIISFDPRKNGLGHTMFISGHSKEHITNLIKGDLRLASFLINNKIDYKKDVRITSDDWPYMYLQKPEIPNMHLIFIGILLSLFFVSKRFLLPRGQRLDFHFFFLGSAFLLLEFQNINKTALLFGSTWLVNSINISAILILILLANLLVSRINVKNIKIPYALLLISLLIIFLVPLRAYNALGYWQRSVLASIVLNLPIFFAGIIFILSFKNTKHRNLAFGSNLIGAVAGGLLEYISFIIGIRLLVLVTAVLYSLSYAFIKKST